MTPFEWLKLTHVGCALVSIAGFALRGYWKLTGNPLLAGRAARILPHCVDTLLLGSAIGMLVIWQASPLQFNWLVAKICALLLYIALGMVVLRFARRQGTRRLAYVLALLCAAYILSVAYTRSAAGVLSVLAG
jgi:uncharacterized membrane protein SirB2